MTNPFGSRRTALLLAAVATASAAVTTAAPFAATASAATPSGPRTIDGQLADGAAYRLEVPAFWNGTLAVYSHGLRFPGQDNPPETAFSDGSHDWLLDHGYALAGSSYAGTGWA